MKNNLLKYVLWNLVEDKTYIDDTHEQYSGYIKELLKNPNFLIHEYFNSLSVENDIVKQSFIDLINTYQKFDLSALINFLCTLNNLYLDDLKDFLCWLEGVYNRE